MIALAVASLLWAWLSGTLIVAACWPRERRLRDDAALLLPLGIAVGLGVTSAAYVAASLVTSRPLGVCIALEVAAAVSAALVCRLRRRSGAAGPVATAGAPSGRNTVLGSLFAQAALVALVVTARAYHAEPYSNSDGWVIWNMHARFLFRGGPHWPELLRSPLVAWTHPDYPLLVPASVARAWAYAGQDAPGVSGIVSGLFGAATVWLLVAVVARLRHWHVGLVGGLVLLGTPFFVTFSSNQHADIPLGLYILTAVSLSALSTQPGAGAGWRVLAGVAAGMAAWTKNEGLLFALVLATMCVAQAAVTRRWRDAGAFLLGLAAGLTPVAYFKFALSPANDLVASHPWDRLAHVLDGSRHRLILSSFARDVRRFGEWSIVPFVVMALPLLGPGWRRIRGGEWLVAAVVGLTLAGYYAVYLLTHWDLAAHLDSSLVRLLVQLWPATVLFWCLAVTCEPAEPRATGVRPARRWAAFVLLANIAVAAATFAVLGRQLAANELAAADAGGARVHVLLGDGWFGRETLAGDRWAWSRGESTLLLRLDGSDARDVPLRLTLRGLGTRTVTASVAEREIWRGRIGEEPLTIDLPALALRPGTTPLVLRTDAPGVPESKDPGARALTYAVYNPEVRK